MTDAFAPTISGYSLNVFYFEIAESLRKLSLVGLPVFFDAGDPSQLIFGLIICFITFGLVCSTRIERRASEGSPLTPFQLVPTMSLCF